MDSNGWLVADSLTNGENTSSLDRKLSPKSSRKEQNKHYAKLNRRRKKEYTLELEQKVERLEAEIVRLNKKIKNLQSLPSGTNVCDKTILDEFKEAEDYRRNGLVNDLK